MPTHWLATSLLKVLTGQCGHRWCHLDFLIPSHEAHGLSSFSDIFCEADFKRLRSKWFSQTPKTLPSLRELKFPATETLQSASGKEEASSLT